MNKLQKKPENSLPGSNEKLARKILISGHTATPDSH